MSVGQRLVTLAMNKLPPSALRRLSGGGEVRRDGLTLDPDAQFLLRLLALSGNRGVAQLEPAAARAEMRRAIALGSVLASLVVEKFGMRRLWELAPADIEARRQAFLRLTDFHTI